MTPQPIDPHLYFKIVNAMCRVMALWFVFVSYVAMLVPILGLVVGALGTRGPEIIPYSLKMMLGFEWASGSGSSHSRCVHFVPTCRRRSRDNQPTGGRAIWRSTEERLPADDSIQRPCRLRYPCLSAADAAGPAARLARQAREARRVPPADTHDLPQT